MRVRCYYRTSSEEQADNWSIDAQERDCRAFVAAHPGWQLDGPPYVDQAWSGRTVHRPAFQQMLADARAGQFDVLVCHKLDRFSRSPNDALVALDELQSVGVALASASEDFDFTTPAGRAALVMLARFAELYLRNMSEEMTKGKRARFEAGYWNGDLRYGYSKSIVDEGAKDKPSRRCYKPVPNDDARFVVRAYELCAEGHVDRDIADELNRAGARTYRLITNAKTKAGPDTDPSLRRPWTRDSVAALFNREAAQFYLGNTMYVGEVERKKLERDQLPRVRYGTHEAIITQDLCDRALATRARRTTSRYGAAGQSPRLYLLGGGIAHCRVCGKPLRCTNSKWGEQYLYYRCASWLRGQPCSASRQQIREEVLEPQLEDYMRAIQLPDDWRARLVESVLVNDEKASLEKRRTELVGQLRRLNYQFEHGLIDEADWDAYEAKARRIALEINSIVIPDPNNFVEVGERLLALSAAWAHADKAGRHTILRTIFEAVYVDTDAKQITGVRPHAEYVPAFRYTALVVRGGEFVLANEKTAQH